MRDVTEKEPVNTFKAMTMERYLEKHFAKQGWLTLLSLQINTAETILFFFFAQELVTVMIQVYIERYTHTHTQSRFAMRKVQALISYRLEEAGTFRSSSERASETFKK